MATYGTPLASKTEAPPETAISGPLPWLNLGSACPTMAGIAQPSVALGDGLAKCLATKNKSNKALSSPKTPAFGPRFAPPKSAFDRLRDRIVWGATNLGMKKQVAELDRLRARIGAEPVGQHSGIFLRADALLYLTAEPFDYARSHWPTNVHAIGPGLWSPKGGSA